MLNALKMEVNAETNKDIGLNQQFSYQNTNQNTNQNMSKWIGYESIRQTWLDLTKLNRYK